MLFSVGKVKWSKNLLAHSGIEGNDLIAAFEQYISGDWGEVSANEALVNDLALTSGDSIIGRYVSSAGVPFCIETDRHRTYLSLSQTSRSCSEMKEWFLKEK